MPKKHTIIKSETTEARTPSVFDLFDLDPAKAVRAVTEFMTQCSNVSKESKAAGLPPVRVLSEPTKGVELVEAFMDGLIIFHPSPGLGDPEVDDLFARVRAEAIRYLGVEPVVNAEGDIEIRRDTC